jgi:hypothetical protein
MAAITSRRKSTGTRDQAAELEQLHAENAELRTALKAVAALAVGIGFHRQTASVSPPRDIAGICLMNGVSGQYAALIEALFS